MENHEETHSLSDISRLLSSESTASDTLPDLGWARAVLNGQRLDPPADVDAEIATALVEQLVSNQASDTVSWLATTKQRVVSKLARRALHQLRSRKVDVALPTSPGISARDTGSVGTQKDLPAVITRYDSAGYRAVWVPTTGLKGVDILATQLSYRHGIVSYDARSLSRKQYRSIVKRLQEEAQAIVAAAAEALWLVNEAVQLCETLGRPLPTNLTGVLKEFGVTSVSGEHPALQIAAIDDDLSSVYEIDELRGWMPDRDFLQRIALRYQEIATSTLYIDNEQRSAQWATTLDKSIAEYFTEEQCAASRRLLLDSAHLLAATKKTDDAQRVRAAADLFSGATEAIIAHPVVRHYLARFFPASFAPPKEEEAPEQEETRSEGGIILP